MPSLVLGKFQQKDVLTQKPFDLGTFRHGIFLHLNILAHGFFGTLQSNMDVLAQTFWHLCYCAKMSTIDSFLLYN